MFPTAADSHHACESKSASPSVGKIWTSSIPHAKGISNFSYPLWKTRKPPNLETWWPKLVQLRNEIKDRDCESLTVHREKTKDSEAMESRQENWSNGEVSKNKSMKKQNKILKAFYPQPAIFHSNLLQTQIRVLLDNQGDWKHFTVQYKCSYVIPNRPVEGTCGSHEWVR